MMFLLLFYRATLCIVDCWDTLWMYIHSRVFRAERYSIIYIYEYMWNASLGTLHWWQLCWQPSTIRAVYGLVYGRRSAPRLLYARTHTHTNAENSAQAADKDDAAQSTPSPLPPPRSIVLKVRTAPRGSEHKLRTKMEETVGLAQCVVYVHILNMRWLILCAALCAVCGFYI